MATVEGEAFDPETVILVRLSCSSSLYSVAEVAFVAIEVCLYVCMQHEVSLSGFMKQVFSVTMGVASSLLF